MPWEQGICTAPPELCGDMPWMFWHRLSAAVDETLRLIKAFQFVAEHGEVRQGGRAACLLRGLACAAATVGWHGSLAQSGWDELGS